MVYKPRTRVGASAKALFEDLAGLQYHGVMFGHQDASLTGCIDCKSKWTATGGPMLEPDVFRVSGKYPAVYGFDLGWLTDEEALPLVPPLFTGVAEAFDIHKSLAYFCHAAGGILTFSWHVSNSFARSLADLRDLQLGKGEYKDDNPGARWKKLYGPLGRLIVNDDPAAVGKTALNDHGELHETLRKKLDIIADFANSLKDDNGPIPILFRPWHENNLVTWWWGRSANPDEDYKALWRATVDYLDGAGATNLLYVYSPNVVALPTGDPPTPLERFKQSFEATYPGADVVDVLGIDFYPESLTTDVLIAQVDYLCQRAKKEGKLAAISECGLKRLTRNGSEVNDYWTKEYIAPFWENDDNLLSYALVWKNVDPKGEFWGPFPEQRSVSDFKGMAGNSTTLVRSGRRFRAKVLFRDEVVAKRADFARWQTPYTP